MKNKFIKLCALGFGALTFFGCQKEEDAMMPQGSNAQNAHLENCDAIDFNQYNTGFISEVNSSKGMGPVRVMNMARNSSGEMVEGNRAMIFDMANPTGDDTDDLFHPSLGKGLIINHLNTSVPNDNQWGGVMMLDFSAIGPVTINETTVVDIDEYEDASFIRLYDVNGKMVKEHKLKAMGNGSVQIAELYTSNVMKMEVMLAGSRGSVGSGAIDDIMFCVMPKVEERGCTRTQGYWKTHGDMNNMKKYDKTWNPYVNKMFFSSNMTFMQVLDEPVKGRPYFILAHQYIAAMLNVAAGASMPSDVKAAYDAATSYFQNTTSITSKDMKDKVTAWASMLDDYNNGKTGPGHCD